MIKQPKFSIIMSVYNVQEYIDEAISSVLSQDIGFTDNIQLILVNDGSTDGSNAICQKYAQKYPANIKCITKKNGGLASARNTGLKYATGTLINFFDPDDILTPNVLSQVWSFWKRNKLFIDMIAIPLVYFGSATGLHGKYQPLGECNRIVDLLQEPHNAILSAASTFYNAAIIKDYKFNTKLSIGEDLEFNLRLYRRNPRFGYVCENNVQYMYRRRNNSSSLVDNVRNGSPAFIRMVPQTVPGTSKSSPTFEKELVAYQLRAALRKLALPNCRSRTEYQQIISELKQFAGCLDTEFIIHRSYWCNTFDRKVALLKLLDVNYAKLINNGQLPFIGNIKLRERRVNRNTLTIDVVHNSYGSDISVVAYDGNSKVIQPAEETNLSSPYDVVYGPFTLSNTTHTVFKLDLRRSRTVRFCFYNRTNDTYLPIAHIRLSPSSRLSPVGTGSGIRHHGQLVTFNGRKLKISASPHHSTLAYDFHTTLSIHRKYHRWAIWRLFTKRTKKYILINDRPNKADDNGEALFRHINNHCPSLAKHTYYVIGDVDKHELRRLKKIGHIIKHGSIKHKIAFLNAKYIFSSHNHPTFFSAFKSDVRLYYSDLLDYTFVWLQHGITMNDISRSCNRLNVEDNFIVTATTNEANELKQSKYFYSDKSILTTGFPRYDLLSSNPSDIITFMPTWRNNLSGPINERGEHTAIPDFDRSDYYRRIVDILASKKLATLLHTNNLHFNFIMHAGIEEYADYFTKFNTDRVHIIKGSDYSYRKAFSESKLLITDYSSVAFDFAYLKKPVIYYQFDEQEFFTKHYRRGYFDYRKNGFGEIVTTAQQVVSLLENYANSNFLLKQKYSRRIDETFHYHDHNNCERVLRAVLPEGLLQ